MRKRCTRALLVPLACAALAAGCGRGDNATDTRAAQDADTSSERIAVNGCVGLSPGGGQEYALQHVRTGALGEQPSQEMTHTSSTAIEEGSWVRLTLEEGGQREQLRQLVGQRVTIHGTIRDDGRDTIGTSGPRPGPQEPDPRQPESRAGADEHHSEKVAKEAGAIGQQWLSTGTAPLIVVQRIQNSGEPCNPEVRQPENRR
jgi:hypothetical protein